MKISALIVFCASIVFAETKHVKVSIYYEALCYDSTRFIAGQVYPNYAKLKNYVQLEFIPFGKAVQNYYGGRWHFDCQHGRDECRGNKYQACTLAQKNGQDKDLAFVNCVMRENNPADVNKIRNCANKFHLNWNDINICAKSKLGDELLAGHGNKTNSLEPNLSFVPTVVYNDRYDSYLQDVSQTDFAAVVCSKITAKKPPICINKSLPEQRSFWDYFE